MTISRDVAHDLERRLGDAESTFSLPKSYSSLPTPQTTPTSSQEEVIENYRNGEQNNIEWKVRMKGNWIDAEEKDF